MVRTPGPSTRGAGWASACACGSPPFFPFSCSCSRGVANDGSATVRVFDSGGRFLREIGRRGEGPGEFHFVDRPILQGEDVLLVRDYRRNLASLFRTDGTHLATFAAVMPDGRLFRPIGGTDGGWIGEFNPFMSNPRPYEVGQARQDTSRIVHVPRDLPPRLPPAGTSTTRRAGSSTSSKRPRGWFPRW